MVESLIGMGKYFFCGFSVLFVVLVAYALLRSPFVAYTPFMALVSQMWPACTFILVAAAIGAYLGSLIDWLLGVDEVFASAGVVGGGIVGLLTLWRRRGVEREA